jgi:hypothetical protein
MKILILGAGGMLGHKLAQVLSRQHQVFAAVRRDPTAYEPLGLIDRTHKSVFTRYDYPAPLGPILCTFDPKWVVNCIGVVKQLKAASDPLVAARAMDLDYVARGWIRRDGDTTVARYAYDGTARRGASHAGMAQAGVAENRLVGKPDSRLFSGTFLLVTHALETAG